MHLSSEPTQVDDDDDDEEQESDSPPSRRLWDVLTSEEQKVHRRRVFRTLAECNEPHQRVNVIAVVRGCTPRESRTSKDGRVYDLAKLVVGDHSVRLMDVALFGQPAGLVGTDVHYGEQPGACHACFAAAGALTRCRPTQAICWCSSTSSWRNGRACCR